MSSEKVAQVAEDEEKSVAEISGESCEVRDGDHGDGKREIFHFLGQNRTNRTEIQAETLGNTPSFRPTKILATILRKPAETLCAKKKN